MHVGDDHEIASPTVQRAPLPEMLVLHQIALTIRFSRIDVHPLLGEGDCQCGPGCTLGAPRSPEAQWL